MKFLTVVILLVAVSGAFAPSVPQELIEALFGDVSKYDTSKYEELKELNCCLTGNCGINPFYHCEGCQCVYKPPVWD
jgi:hypothetical protein